MFRPITFLVAIALLAAACSSGSADTTLTTTTTVVPTTEQILAEAAVTMQTVETLRYEIELSGAVISLLGFELRSAVGQYAAPNASQALLNVAVGGITVELATIAVGDRSWVAIPFIGGWDEYEGSRAFNPAIIFDPQLGWLPLLTEDISDARLVEPVEGDFFIVRGTAAGSRVEVLTAGLVESQPVALELQIERGTGLVTRIDFTTVGEAGETRWLLQMSEFGEPVSISPPEDG
jgi:hypothetical protein